MQIQIPYVSGCACLLFARSPVREARAKPIGVAPREAHRVFIEAICRSIGAADPQVDLLLPSDHADALRELTRKAVGEERRVVTVPVGGDGFGPRLARGFAGAFERGYSQVVAVVGDCPELRPRHLHRALGFLRDGVPSVVGPTPDGGLYLLGLSRMPEGLFEGVTFCGRSTRADLIASLVRHGVGPLLIESLADIDSDQDLWRLRQRLQRLVPGSRLAADISCLVTASASKSRLEEGAVDQIAGAPIPSVATPDIAAPRRPQRKEKIV